MYKDKKSFLICAIGRTVICGLILILMLASQFSVVTVEKAGIYSSEFSDKKKEDESFEHKLYSSVEEAFNESFDQNISDEVEDEEMSDIDSMGESLVEENQTEKNMLEGDYVFGLKNVVKVGTIEFANSCFENAGVIENYKKKWDGIYDQIGTTTVNGTYTFVNGHGKQVTVDQAEISQFRLMLTLSWACCFICGLLMYAGMIVSAVMLGISVWMLVGAIKIRNDSTIKETDLKYEKDLKMSALLSFGAAVLLFSFGVLGGLNATLEAHKMHVQLQLMSPNGLSPLIWVVAFVVISLFFEYKIKEKCVIPQGGAKVKK